MTRRVAVLALLLAPAAHAHEVDGLTPASWTHAWSWEPGIVVSLFLSAAFYLAGLHNLRTATETAGKLRREAFSFWSGWALLVIALLSPLHPLGSVLFSAHMVQHELLMVAAAPLLVLGKPGLVWLWALPRTQARHVGRIARTVVHRQRWLLHPATAWLGHALALWVWHIPVLFDATIDHDFVHALQHGCFLGSAIWFWHAVFYGPQRRAAYGMGVVYLFTTALHSGALGALITFANSAWYPAYAATSIAWGLSPVEDQQLGGLIMWVPGGLTYIIAALALFAGWMRESDRRAAAGSAGRLGCQIHPAAQTRSAQPPTEHAGRPRGRPAPSPRPCHHMRAVTVIIVLLLVGAAGGTGYFETQHHRAIAAEAQQLTGGDPQRGHDKMREYGCIACHAVPGFAGNNALVGPPLAKFGLRMYVAGAAENKPGDLMHFIMEPRTVVPHGAMPNLHVTERDARDLAAYLYTLQ